MYRQLLPRLSTAARAHAASSANCRNTTPSHVTDQVLQTKINRFFMSFPRYDTERLAYYYKYVTTVLHTCTMQIRECSVLITFCHRESSVIVKEIFIQRPLNLNKCEYSLNIVLFPTPTISEIVLDVHHYTFINMKNIVFLTTNNLSMFVLCYYGYNIQI